MNQLTHHFTIRVLLCIMVVLVAGMSAVADVNVTDRSQHQNEPMMAINTLDHDKLVVGYNDERSGSWRARWSWSDNGGTNWTHGGSFLVSGYTKSGDPVVAFDASDTCYYAGLAYNTMGSFPYVEDGSIFLAKSSDGGHTFATPTVVAAGSGTTNYLDKPWLYVNPYSNHIYVAWVKRVNLFSATTEQMSIWFAYSTNGGSTFSTPVKVSDFSPETGTNRTHGPQITAVSANHVYVAWHTLEDGDPVTTPYRIWIAESTNGGASFGTNHLAVTADYGIPNKFVSMDADPSTGRIYITYSDSPVSSPRDYDVYVISSLSASGTWSGPVRVNNVTSNWQFWPTLDVAPNGRVDVVWYDQRSAEWESEFYYSSSTDGGSTWTTNTKISSPATGFDWPSEDGPGTFAGDYSTVASVDQKAVAAWMDNRDGNSSFDRQDIYMASHSTGIEVPVLNSPAVGITTDNNLPTFEWSGTASYYTLEVSGGPFFTDLVVSESPIYSNSYTLTTPIPFSDYDWQPGPGGGPRDPHYYWRVKAHYLPGGETGLSSVSKFIIDGPHEVPTEYATISAARGAFPTYLGGTVLVHPGTYTGSGNCNVFMGGEKPVNIISTDGPEVTIIDCQDTYYGFYFDLYTVGAPEVNGFTIRRADGTGDIEGAFVCWTGSATVRNCIIEECGAPGVKAFRGGRANVYNTVIRGGDEGAIVTTGGSLKMVGCEIYSQWGWGIEAHDRDGGDASSVEIDSCLFYDNDQGDILIWGANTVDISNTTIVPLSTGLWFYAGFDSSTVSNTIVAFSPSSGVRWYQTDNSVTFDCCDIFGNSGGDWTDRAASQLGVGGNISADPEFCDQAADIYGLLPTSPCTEVNSSCGGMGALDVCLGYTPPGSDVEVDVSDEVTVVFEQVTSAGTTTVDVIDPGDTETPADFSIEPTTEPVLYQVSTTATVSGEITICFEYDESLISVPEDQLRLLHSDGSLPLVWDDITILPVDIANNIICGNPPSLSPFAVGYWCCGMYSPTGVTGNANCSTDGLRTLSDITRLIDHVYVSKAPLCCEGEGNTNGSVDGKITLSDITRLIDNVYISKEKTAACD